MSRINFMLNWVEHEKSFITSGLCKIRKQNKIFSLPLPVILAMYKLYTCSNIYVFYLGLVSRFPTFEPEQSYLVKTLVMKLIMD